MLLKAVVRTKKYTPLNFEYSSLATGKGERWAALLRSPKIPDCLFTTPSLAFARFERAIHWRSPGPYHSRINQGATANGRRLPVPDRERYRPNSCHSRSRRHLSTRRYARLVDAWVTGVGLMRSAYGRAFDSAVNSRIGGFCALVDMQA